MTEDIANIPLQHLEAELARRSHLEFMKFMWQKRDELKIGVHTKTICSRIDKAVEDYKKGKSTYLAIKCPFRHGKSDIVSRYLPANFIGKFPEEEVIVSGYSLSLVRTFSKFARRLMTDKKYQTIYPGVSLAKDSRSLEEWGVDDDEDTAEGHVYWTGIKGTVTGKGGSLIILDDFFKGRKEANSDPIRDTVWHNITNEILTRQAPVCIVIILATPWDVDDPFGRIKKRMAEDPDFPRFEELKFPAESSEYKTGYLFPERLPPEWYRRMKASLGPFAAAGLLQCDPVLKSGNQLKTDKIKIIEESEVPDGIIFTRGWDLASSEKQRISDDPDYTVGIKLGIQWVDSGVKDEPIPILYITDMIRGRWEAPKRDRIIRDAAIVDRKIKIGVEGFGGYKDAYTRVAEVLSGLRIVKKVNLPGDKVAKAETLENPFFFGNVHLLRGDWNDAFIQEVSQFPGGAHDDIVDALTVAYDCHSPHLRRVFPDFSNGHLLSFKIDFNNISQNSTLIISSWMDRNLETSCIMALWNQDKGKLFVFGDYVSPNPYPQTTIIKLASMLRVYSGGKKRDLKGFEWYGNKLMFSNQRNMQTEYRRRSVHLREGVNYDEFSAISRVATLIKYSAIRIHPQCGDLIRQMQDWTTSNKPISSGQEIDEFGLCRALTLMASMLYDTGRMRRPQKKVDPYSKKGNMYKKQLQDAIRTGKAEEFSLGISTSEGDKDSWMKI